MRTLNLRGKSLRRNKGDIVKGDLPVLIRIPNIGVYGGGLCDGDYPRWLSFGKLECIAENAVQVDGSAGSYLHGSQPHTVMKRVGSYSANASLIFNDLKLSAVIKYVFGERIYGDRDPDCR